MVFTAHGCIKRYETAVSILKDFYEVRIDYYQRRKDYLEGMLAAETLRLNNIARFIMEKIDGTVVIGMHYISTYINTKMSVCVSVCLRFSRPFGIRLGYHLAQSCF